MDAGDPWTNHPPPARAIPTRTLLFQGGHGAGEAEVQSGIQRTDVDAELQGVCGGDGDERAAAGVGWDAQL